MSMHKKRLVIACAIALTGHLNAAVADIATDANTLLNWGEINYPNILTESSDTQRIDGWYYRYYTKSKAYVGINSMDNGVYILYGQPGDKPTYVDSLANLLARMAPVPVSPTPAPLAEPTPTPTPLIIDTPLPPPIIVDKSEVACDSATAPQGVSYTQNGSNITISTNGQCIATPKTDMCIPTINSASGISVLKQLNLQTYTLNGLSFADPAMAAVMDPQIKSYGSIKSCIQNVPQEMANLTMTVDGCFDVTEQVKDFPSIPGLFTVKPPVTMQMQGNLASQIVPDCFKTDATIITDALTREVWDWNKSKNAFIKR